MLLLTNKKHEKHGGRLIWREERRIVGEPSSSTTGVFSTTPNFLSKIHSVTYDIVQLAQAAFGSSEFVAGSTPRTICISGFESKILAVESFFQSCRFTNVIGCTLNVAMEIYLSNIL